MNYVEIKNLVYLKCESAFKLIYNDLIPKK